MQLMKLDLISADSHLREIGHGGILKLRYNCVAKVLMVGCAAHLAYGPAREKCLPKISYIIGSREATVEVVALGASVQKVSPNLGLLKGKVITLENVMWDGKYCVLKHGPATLVQETDEYEELFTGVNFQFSVFHVIGTVKPWTRISLQGCVHSLDIPQASERRSGQSFCELLLQNEAGQAVKVKMVACHVPLPVLQERQKISVLNCKVNSATETLYADMDDLCEVQIKGMSGSSYPGELKGMVTWQLQ